MEYELVGAPGDRPVLFLPALLGGSAISDAMAYTIAQSGLRLIMPWRPLLGRGVSCGAPTPARFEDYARDIVELLDYLNIDKVPVFGQFTSAMFAYALGHHLPDRISHVANINGIVPVNSGAHVKMLERGERMRFYIHRHLPKIASMVIVSMLRVIDSGQDIELLRVFLKDSPQDLETLSDKEIPRPFSCIA